jgi:hypothetical protein
MADPALAADLSAVDRTVVREPTYRGKPSYCLLVFGPNAEVRTWLVLDGPALYADRNGNGDLTEEGERVVGEPHPQIPTAVRFKPGPLSALGLINDTRVEVQVEENLRRKARLVIVSCRADRRLAQRAAADRAGLLAFGDTPKAAPVIHFHGPLTISPRSDEPLGRGPDAAEWEVMVGTPGHGPGTFARVAHDGIPAKARPVAEFTFPTAGGTSKVRVSLDGRC